MPKVEQKIRDSKPFPDPAIWPALRDKWLAVGSTPYLDPKARAMFGPSAFDRLRRLFFDPRAVRVWKVVGTDAPLAHRLIEFSLFAAHRTKALNADTPGSFRLTARAAGRVFGEALETLRHQGIRQTVFHGAPGDLATLERVLSRAQARAEAIYSTQPEGVFRGASDFRNFRSEGGKRQFLIRMLSGFFQRWMGTPQHEAVGALTDVLLNLAKPTDPNLVLKLSRTLPQPMGPFVGEPYGPPRAPLPPYEGLRISF